MPPRREILAAAHKSAPLTVTAGMVAGGDEPVVGAPSLRGPKNVQAGPPTGSGITNRVWPWAPRVEHFGLTDPRRSILTIGSYYTSVDRSGLINSTGILQTAGGLAKTGGTRCACDLGHWAVALWNGQHLNP